MRATRGSGVVLVVAFVIAAAPAAAGNWTIVRSFSVNETFTDNVDLDPDADDKSAIVTEVTPGLSVRGAGRRLNLSFDASPTFRHQTSGDDKGVNVDVNYNGSGTLEVAPERLFVDASASISRQILDTREADSVSNQQTVQTYRLSPSVRQHFGGFADAELRYALDQVFVDSRQSSTTSSDVSDSTSHQLNFTLDGGRQFSQLNWSLSASGSEESRTDDSNISRRDVNLTLEYAVARYLSLIGAGGYQNFDDGDPANDIDGPTWRAGFRLRPGPRTELFATYGESDDQENLDLTFRYDVTTRTRLFASYAETLDTSQGRLSQTLSFIGTDPVTGEIIDTRTGLPFDPNANPQTIRNETTRTKTLSIGVSGSRNRNTFGLVATFVNEAIEPAMDGDDSITVDANWGRQLNRRLQMNLSGNYQNIAFGDQPREDDEYTVTGGLTYTIFSGTSAGVNAGLKYSFRKRDSQQEINEFTENSIVVTLSAVF